MSKIRVRFGTNEVEIESRDFYIDNNTAPQIIADLTSQLQENSAKIVVENPTESMTNDHKKDLDYLKILKNVEVHEPEFAPPEHITAFEIPHKIEELEKNAFFTKPRTVSETVEQLREYGWVASPLDVSKILTKMAFHRELVKELLQDKAYYFKGSALISHS